MTALQPDNPFWQFSLAVYGKAGVAEECIGLQDSLGIDVNVLLYAVWLGADCGIALSPDDIQSIEAVSESWALDVVQPLRAVRRRIKSMPDSADPAVGMLRKQVASTELLAEQVEQAMLFALSGSIGRQLPVRAELPRGNVAALLTRHGSGFGTFPLSALLAAAAAVSGSANLSSTGPDL